MKIKGLTVEQVDHHVDAFTKLMLKGMQQVCDAAVAHSLTADATDGELTTTFDGLSVMATQWGEYTTGTLVPTLEQFAIDAAKAVATPLGNVSPIKTTQFVADMTNAISGFSDDMWKAAQTALITGVQDGASVAELATAVQDVAQVKAKKAHVIAQTSVIAAINGGEWQQMLEAAAAFDLEGVKEWEATEDAHTRPTHHEADGQRVPIDSHFVVGGSFLMFPGDPSGDPSEIISCRCTTLYDLDVDAPITASQTSPETLSTSLAVDANGQVGPLDDGVVTAAVNAQFNAMHPRGKDGKFIKKGVGLPEHVLEGLIFSKKSIDWSLFTPNEKSNFISEVNHITLKQWDNLKDGDKKHIKQVVSDALDEGEYGSAKASLHLDKLTDEEGTSGLLDDGTNVFDPNTPLPEPEPISAPTLTTGSSTPIKITHGLIHAKHAPGTIIAQSNDGVEVEWNGSSYDIVNETGEVEHSGVKKSKLYALLNSQYANAKWHSPGKQETAVSHATPLDAAPVPNAIPHPSTPTPTTVDAKKIIADAKASPIGTVLATGERPASGDKYRLVVAEHSSGQRYASEQTWNKISKEWDETGKHYNADDLNAAMKTQATVGIEWTDTPSIAAPSSIAPDTSTNYPVGSIDAYSNVLNGTETTLYSTNGEHKLTKYNDGGVALSSKQADGTWSEPSPAEAHTLPMGQKWTNKASTPNTPSLAVVTTNGVFFKWGSKKYLPGHIIAGGKDKNGEIWYAKMPPATQDKYIHISQADNKNGQFLTPSEFSEFAANQGITNWTLAPNVNDTATSAISTPSVSTPSTPSAPSTSFTPFDEDSAVTDMADVTGLPDEKAVQIKVLLHQFNKGMMTKQEFADQVNLVHTGAPTSTPTITPTSVTSPTSSIPTPSASVMPVTLNDLDYYQKSTFYTHFKNEKVSPAWSGAKIYASIHAAKLKMSGDPKIAALSDSEMLKLVDWGHWQSKAGMPKSAYSQKVKEWLKTPNGQKAFKQLNPAIPTGPANVPVTSTPNVPAPSAVVKKAAKSAKKTASSTSSLTVADALGDMSDPALSAVKKQSVYSSFKSVSYGKYLDSKPEEIYWNTVQQAKALGLSEHQVLSTVDAEGAKKFGVANAKSFEKKVTDWLGTPSGKKKAAEIKAGTWSPSIATPSYSGYSSYGSSSSTSYAHPANTPLNDKIPPLNTSVEDFDSSKAYNWKKDSPDFPVINHNKAQKLVDAWTAQHGPLKPSEKSALRKYTGSAYSPMNNYLRGYSGASEQTHKDVQNAQAGMRLSTEPIVLHRGNSWFSGWSSVAEVKSHLGEDFHQEAFFSTSIGGKSAFSGPINFVIECPTGTPMQYVKTFSQYGGEDEMLLAGNLTYKVVEVIEGNKAPDGSNHYNTKVTVRLRVIPPSENQISYGSNS